MRLPVSTPVLAREVFLSSEFSRLSDACATEGGRAALRTLVLRSCWSASGERVPATPGSVKYAQLRTIFRPEVDLSAREDWGYLEPLAKRWSQRSFSASPTPLRDILPGVEGCPGAASRFMLAARMLWVLGCRPFLAVSSPFFYAMAPYVAVRCIYPEASGYPLALYLLLVINVVVYAVRLCSFFLGMAIGSALSRLLIAALLISNAASYVKASSECFSESRAAFSVFSETFVGHSAFTSVRSDVVLALTGRRPQSGAAPPSWPESCLQYARRTGARDREALRAAWVLDALNSVADTAHTEGWVAADSGHCISLGPMSVKGVLAQAFGYAPM